MEQEKIEPVEAPQESPVEAPVQEPIPIKPEPAESPEKSAAIATLNKQLYEMNQAYAKAAHGAGDFEFKKMTCLRDMENALTAIQAIKFRLFEQK